jgi:hypothetical protein
MSKEAGDPDSEQAEPWNPLAGHSLRAGLLALKFLGKLRSKPTDTDKELYAQLQERARDADITIHEACLEMLK